MKRFGVKVSALLLVFSLTSTAASFAGEISWEFAGWYGAGCYPNVVFDRKNPDRVYLTSDVAGIWRSDDGGENWRFINKGLTNLRVSLIEPAPSDPSVLYAGTDAGVFSSQDGGANWKAADNGQGAIVFSRPESYRSIIVSTINAGCLVVGSSRGGVYYSEDFGHTWELLGGRKPFATLDPITAAGWAPHEEGVYVSSKRGIAFFSFEKGAKWKVFSQGPSPVTDFQLSVKDETVTIYAAGQKKLWVSKDGGETWSSGAEIPAGHIYRVLLRPDGSLLAGWNENWKGGVVKTEDGGATWAKWERAMKADKLLDPTRAWAGVHGRITALKTDPFKPERIFRTDFWGVWRSDDGGQIWKEKIKGAPNSVMSDIAIGPDSSLYVASMDNGLLKSADGGATYKCIFPEKGYAADVNGHVWRVLISGTHVVATSTPWEADLNQVIVSEDSGATFQKIRNGLPAKKPVKNTVWGHGYGRALAQSPAHPDTFYLGIDGDDGGGFFVSKDGGKSWKRTADQPGSLHIYNALAVDPENPDRILWGAGGGIYISEDGGESWKMAANPMKKIFDIAFSKGGRVYAGGQDAYDAPVVWASNDHGNNWELSGKFDGKGSPEGLCVLPDGRLAFGIARWGGEMPSHFYLLSTDGKEYKDIDGDLPGGDGPAAMAYDPKTNTLYMARYAGSVYKTHLEQ